MSSKSHNIDNRRPGRRYLLGSHREDSHDSEGSDGGKEDGQLVVAHGQDGGNEECLVTQL